VMASRTDGEPLVMGKKCRRLPGESAMTYLTIGVEFRSGMPGIGGCSVFPKMARHAGYGSPPEPVLGMARFAGERCMDSTGREIGVVVIE
jgi:hypothetical protein